MATDALTVLKFNLQEREYPYFTDTELEILLETNDNDVKKASYKGCIMKAQADSVELKGLKIESSREYFLKLAKSFKTTDYITSLKRADEK